jgi:hypothetical protein
MDRIISRHNLRLAVLSAQSITRRMLVAEYWNSRPTAAVVWSRPCVWEVTFDRAFFSWER